MVVISPYTQAGIETADSLWSLWGHLDEEGHHLYFLDQEDHTASPELDEGEWLG